MLRSLERRLRGEESDPSSGDRRCGPRPRAIACRARRPRIPIEERQPPSPQIRPVVLRGGALPRCRGPGDSQESAGLVRHLHQVSRSLPHGCDRRGGAGRRADLHFVPHDRIQRIDPARDEAEDWGLGFRLRCLLGGLSLRRRRADASARFGTHAALDLGLEDLLLLDDESFPRVFRGSPMRRPKREGLARNACIALGNLRRASGAAALRRAAAGDPSPVVREAAEWALARIA